MVQFKSWRDSYLFLKEFGNFTCLNCKYSNHNLDTDVEHTDMEYATLFCTEYVSMVRLDFQFCCDKWVHQNTGEKILDLDENCKVWKLSDEMIDLIDDESKEWSIEEIREIVNGEEFTEKENQ